MTRLRRGTLLFGVVATVSGAAIAVAGAAGDSKASIAFVGSPELQARGAAVAVPVAVSCAAPPAPAPGFPGTSPSVSVQISQVVDGNVVQQGFGSDSSAVCDGSSHTVTVYVIPGGNGGPFPSSPAHPFVNGTAFAQAQLSACSFPGIVGSVTSSSKVAPQVFQTSGPSIPPPPVPVPVTVTPSGVPPIPPPVFPSCQSASSGHVIRIQGDNEG